MYSANDDAFNAANVISVNNTYKGSISEGGDADYFKFVLNETCKSLPPGTYHFLVEKSSDNTGNYSFTLTATPSTKVDKMNSPSLTSSKKSFRASWSKQDEADGYQIRYSTKKNMKKAKIKKVGAAKEKVKIKKLKKRKTYYVQIRAFKTINGKNYYGKWSKKAKIRTR